MVNELGKQNLKEDVVPGVTWRSVRDAMKKIGFHEFDEQDFCAYIFRDCLAAALREFGSRLKNEDNIHVDKLLKMSVSDIIYLFGERTYRRWGAEVEHLVFIARNNSAKIFRILLESCYVKIAETQMMEMLAWEITENGHTLRMQKDLKRISKDRARKILDKVIKDAEQFNAEDGPLYCINKIIVYGSFLKDVDELGDIDLMVEIDRRDFGEFTPEEWLESEQARYKIVGGIVISGPIVTTVSEPIARIKKSPYLSIAPDSSYITHLEKNNEPFRLVWDKEKGKEEY